MLYVLFYSPSIIILKFYLLISNYYICLVWPHQSNIIFMNFRTSIIIITVYIALSSVLFSELTLTVIVIKFALTWFDQVSRASFFEPYDIVLSIATSPPTWPLTRSHFPPPIYTLVLNWCNFYNILMLMEYKHIIW